MGSNPSCVPIDLGNTQGYFINELACAVIWRTAFEKGFDPSALIIKCTETIENGLGVGFFERPDDDIQEPLVGFIIPEGFWRKR